VEQILQFSVVWIAGIVIALVVRHRIEPASAPRAARVAAWLFATVGAVATLAIATGVLWPGLHPVRWEWLAATFKGQGLRTASAVELGIAGALMAAVGGHAVAKRNYAWVAIVSVASLVVIGATPSPTAVGRIVCLAAGLTGLFWIAGGLFPKDGEEPGRRGTVVMYLLSLLVPWALILGYLEVDRLQAAALSAAPTDPAAFEQAARRIARDLPWSPQVARARTVVAAAETGTYLNPDGGVIAPDAVVARFKELVASPFVGIIADRYRAACLGAAPAATCDENVEAMVDVFARMVREQARDNPWPESSPGLLATLTTLDGLDGYAAIDRLVEDLAGKAAGLISPEGSVVSNELRLTFGRCNELYRAAKFNEAAVCYREGLARAAGVEDLRNNLGLAEWKLGHYTAARVHFTILARTSPKYPGAELNLAVVEYTAGRAADAMARLQRLAKTRPKYVAAYYDQAWILDELGQTDKAAALAKTAMGLRPDYVPPRLLLAFGKVRAERFSEAAALLDTAKSFARPIDRGKVDELAADVQRGMAQAKK
jgi:tetratricopeptide (TPR) repeat protein